MFTSSVNDVVGSQLVAGEAVVVVAVAAEAAAAGIQGAALRRLRSHARICSNRSRLTHLSRLRGPFTLPIAVETRSLRPLRTSLLVLLQV